MPTQKGFIWPKDPLPGNPKRGRRGRLRDVLKGQGPDIYVGTLNTPPGVAEDRHMPGMSTWSHWADRPQQGHHGPGHGRLFTATAAAGMSPLDRYLRTYTLPGTVWGKDRGRMRYDFRTRRYVDVDQVRAATARARDEERSRGRRFGVGFGAGPGSGGVISDIWSRVKYCEDPRCRNPVPVVFVDGRGVVRVNELEHQWCLN